MTDIKKTVKEKYAQVIEKSKETKDASCCTEGAILKQSCPEQGLFAGELIAPSLGCIYDLPGKAQLKEGDIVVDLGSGSGYDIIRAAKLVGKEGKAIGIDMTPEMVAQAKENIAKLSILNAEIKQGEIENIPLENNFADVVISNCVINLSPNKQEVFNEAYRILKPNGRLVDADKIAEEELPESLRNQPELWCGCISGALTKEGYTQLMEKAGFKEINIEIFDKSKFNWEGKEYTLLNGLICGTKK
ncbi:MAG: methyltransferase domain-containing protein [Asgard group archaeon]|nr:methyltransferase domain-containing protein [Asgard group archaeon]